MIEGQWTASGWGLVSGPGEFFLPTLFEGFSFQGPDSGLA